LFELAGGATSAGNAASASGACPAADNGTAPPELYGNAAGRNHNCPCQSDNDGAHEYDRTADADHDEGSGTRCDHDAPGSNDTRDSTDTEHARNKSHAWDARQYATRKSADTSAD
jgi:hypothetical protein